MKYQSTEPKKNRVKYFGLLKAMDHLGAVFGVFSVSKGGREIRIIIDY